MSNVVLVWELGAELGHITRLNALALELSTRGHSVTCIVSGPEQIQQLYSSQASLPYKILTGPGWPPRSLKLSRQPANLSEVLLAVGYHNPQALAKKIADWRNIIAPHQPDIIVYDYAPTALLATKDYACVKIGLDDPFSKPPNTSPLPPFHQDSNVNLANLRISENKLLAAINQAMRELQLPDIEFVYDIFQTDKSFLLSIPELDPFFDWRGTAEYVGLIEANSDRSIKLDWRSELPIRKVFAYLKPEYPKLHALLAVMAELEIESKIFLPDAAPDTIEKYRNTRLQISDRPYDLSQDLDQSDLVICHGGHATVLGSVIEGVPTLIIPLQQEQLNTAKRCIDSGLGLGLGPGVDNREKITSQIRSLLNDSGYRQRARMCGTKYRNAFLQPAVIKIAEYLESTP